MLAISIQTCYLLGESLEVMNETTTTLPQVITIVYRLKPHIATKKISKPSNRRQKSILPVRSFSWISISRLSRAFQIIYHISQGWFISFIHFPRIFCSLMSPHSPKLKGGIFTEVRGTPRKHYKKAFFTKWVEPMGCYLEQGDVPFLSSRVSDYG